MVDCLLEHDEWVGLGRWDISWSQKLVGNVVIVRKHSTLRSWMKSKNAKAQITCLDLLSQRTQRGDQSSTHLSSSHQHCLLCFLLGYPGKNPNWLLMSSNVWPRDCPRMKNYKVGLMNGDLRTAKEEKLVWTNMFKQNHKGKGWSCSHQGPPILVPMDSSFPLKQRWDPWQVLSTNKTKMWLKEFTLSLLSQINIKATCPCGHRNWG